MELKRVVITGLGGVTPLGNTVDEFWKNLTDGVSGSKPITRFDTAEFKTKFACEVKNFDPLTYIDRKDARKMDLYCQFAMAAAAQAVEDARISEDTFDTNKVGVILGVGIGGIETFQDQVVAYCQNDFKPKFSPFFIPKMIGDIACGHISIKYGLRGPNYTTTSACASSTHAIADAFNLIRLGKSEAIVTGGAEAPINPTGVGGFQSMQAISTRNDNPETASRPFCKTRDGFVIGEGGVILILEEYEHAVKRGAKIYAEVVGAGMTADAYHLTAPHPEGLGAYNVMKMALEDAEVGPEVVDYLNVHGTSTPLGDVAELKAVKSLFGEHAYNMNISSTKSMTGHLLGGAGAIESLACILAIRDSLIPPTINHQEKDPDIDEKLNLTLHKAQKRVVKYALSNTFGFGGHNASALFKSMD